MIRPTPRNSAFPFLMGMRRASPLRRHRAQGGEALKTEDNGLVVARRTTPCMKLTRIGLPSGMSAPLRIPQAGPA